MMENEEAAIWGTNAEDFSAAATVVPFDPPLPLLRGPVPAGHSDDPSAGPFVLAFRDAESWSSAFRAAESKIIEQCEAGARVGCSISASNKCKPPWWKSFLGPTAEDFAERERCEEREMSSCLASSKEACLRLAKEKSLLPFRDARIAVIDPRRVTQLIFWASRAANNVSETETAASKQVYLHHETLLNLLEPNAVIMNYRGSALLEKSSGDT